MSQPYPDQPPQPPARFRWGRYTLWTALAATAAFGIGGTIAVSVHDDPDPAACKAALERGWDAYMAQKAAGHDPGMQDPPPACVGLDEKTLKRITGEIMKEKLGESLEDAFKDLETAQP